MESTSQTWFDKHSAKQKTMKKDKANKSDMDKHEEVLKQGQKQNIKRGSTIYRVAKKKKR